MATNRYSITSQRVARQTFRAEIAPGIDPRDTAALDEAFNDWIDGLCKAGEVSERAYNEWTRE